MINSFLKYCFKLDQLAIVMILLVSYIGACVASFASSYMNGDTKYRFFFTHLALLVGSIGIMVCADNLWLFMIASSFSNFILVRLMIYKSSWKAAYASGKIAAKNYFSSAICMCLAFVIFYLSTKSSSIYFINQQSVNSSFMVVALVLILIAAMMQSAIWPFHRWLLSSLNSPKPVSAIMHAGLINGGGFFLVRFALLYLQCPNLLTVIFIIGIGTSLLGTFWKLMQSDVKRMLACSTMGQMGFMFAQCGLGLFTSAIAHLVWHSLFKAYLFLSSSNAAQEKRFDHFKQPKLLVFICSIICGIAGLFGFSYASGKNLFVGDTTLVLLVVAFISASQFALAMLYLETLKRFPIAIVLTTVFGLVYGKSIYVITSMFDSAELIKPQALNQFHIAGIVVLILAWLLFLFMRNQAKLLEGRRWMLLVYVKALNASQPYPETITAHRNHYKYK